MPEENKAVENLEGAIEHFFALFEELDAEVTNENKARILGDIVARSNGMLLCLGLYTCRVQGSDRPSPDEYRETCHECRS
jgi:hypothetical protein